MALHGARWVVFLFIATCLCWVRGAVEVAEAEQVAPNVEMVSLDGLISVRSIVVGEECIAVAGHSPFGEQVVVVEAATMELGATIPVSDFIADMVMVGRDLFVPRYEANRIERFRLSSGCDSYTSTNFPTPPVTGPTSIAALGGSLWFSGSTLGSLDPVTGDVTAYEGYGGRLLAAPEGGYLMTCGVKFGHITISGGEPSQFNQGPETPFNCGALEWGVSDDHIFIERSNVVVYDRSTLSFNSNIAEGSGLVSSVAFDPSRDEVSALSWRNGVGLNALHTYRNDLTRRRLISLQLPMLDGSTAMAFSGDGSNLYMSAGLSGDDDSVKRLWKLPGDPRSAALEISARDKLTIGAKVRVTTMLGVSASVDDLIVRLYADPADGPEALVAEGIVDVDGRFTRSFAPRVNTVYRAEWAGEGDFLPAQATTTVGVAPRIETELRGSYGSSGRYRLLRPGAVPKYSVKVAPNHAGEVVYFSLERFRSGRWREIDDLDVLLGPRSSKAVSIGGLRADERYRVSVKFVQDGDHANARSRYTYLLVR